MTVAMHAIRPARPDERPELVAVAARAFWSDPLFDWCTRDLLEEHRLLARLFTAVWRDLRRVGAEITVAEHRGRSRALAAWMPPETLPRSQVDARRRDFEAAAVLVRSAHPILAARLLQAVEHEHPTEPHWYLALLATDPSAQGRGLGTALLEPVLERCEAEGVLAYTETQKESNVGWYARAGFTVSAEVRVPRTPTIWCLRRELRPARD